MSIFFICLFFLLNEKNSCSETGQTKITSQTLQYFSDEKKYVAEGAVQIEKEDTVINADKVTYYEETSDVIAEGHFKYKNKETSARADRAELNIDRKTGKLYNAEVFQKKENYHLAGKEIEKKSENYYYSPEASFTTCDAPVPAWCFKGRDVKTFVGEEITARDVSFRIKGLPVLYAPYFWASIVSERHTGFLQPIIGSSNTLGARLNIPFFWAISENSDATIVLDAFSKRGIGTGLEYRFLGIGGLASNWWAYHIRDTELDKDLIEIRGLLEDRHPEYIGGFLSINYVNEKDFYRIYSFRHDLHTLRFLESTGEINLPLTNSRFYLLAQYWVDLKNDTDQAPQRLPEAGYVLNYTRLGPFMFSADLSASDFWRKGGLSAGRLDVYPKLLYSMGSDFSLSQLVAFRDTAYAFYNSPAPTGDETTQRAAFEYDAIAHTKLYKVYSSFTHIIEPSLRYHFIYSSQNNLPSIFDSAEIFGKTSQIEFSILNRFLVEGSELAVMRVTQAYDTYKTDGSFLPLKLEAGMKGPVPIVMEATYDVDKGALQTVTSNLFLNVHKATLALGQRYSKMEDVMMLTASTVYNPIKSIQLLGSLWYDAKGQGLREVHAVMRYLRQCWGISIAAVKKPGDFAMSVKFELAGLGSKVSRKDFPAGTYEPF